MNFDEIVVKESPGICRCCLSEGCYKDLGSEYTWMNETEVYADMLLDCFDIGITQHNDGPNGAKRLICEVCITRLRDACNFKKQVVDSEKRFIDMLGRGDFRPKAVMPYQAQVELKLESIEPPEDVMSQDVEYLEDMEYEGDEEEVKTEEVQVTPTASTSEPRPKRGRPRKDDDKPKKQKVAKDDSQEQVGTKEQCRKNLEILFNNTTIVPIKIKGTYRCFFCEVRLKDRPQLVEHNLTHLPCSTDDNSLKTLRGPDYKVNVDVSEVQCKICSEQFPNIADIGFHLAHKHDLPYIMDIEIIFGLYRLADFKCAVCDKDYKNLRTLTIHMKNEHLDRYMCNLCGKKFSQKNVLQYHITEDHRQEYDCPKCSMRFKSKTEYEEHKNENHISHCILCPKTFSSFALRYTHMKAEHKPKEGGTCRFCQKHIRSKTGILAHACTDAVGDYVKTAVDKKGISLASIRQKKVFVLNNTTLLPFKYIHNRIQCFFCPKKFLSGKDFRNHSTIEHSDSIITLRNSRQTKVDASILECKLCHSESKDIKSLVAHLDSEHRTNLGDIACNFLPFELINDRFPCPDCGEEFSYVFDMFGHFNKHHNMLTWVLCLYCGKSFHSEASLQHHTDLYHKKQKDFKCTECGRTFIYKNYLRLHMGSVHKRKVLKCSDCSEWFVSHHARMKHCIKYHDGGYKCTKCGAPFATHTNMIKHVRTVHLKEKNIECVYCNRSFFDQYALKKHMLVHTGEKTVMCEHCDKTFKCKNRLISHMYVHTDVKPFSCKFCGKKYKSKQNLKQHMNIHMEQAFTCHYCNKKFYWKQNLCSHMRVHLGNAGRKPIIK